MRETPAGLSRFVTAHWRDFPRALAEIRRGRKETHWMWYIFPQLAALGQSSMAKFYGLRDLAEAEAFFQDPYLGGNLVEISQALLELPERDPALIFPYPDDLKLRSSMTLFSLVPGTDPVFSAVLKKYYSGMPDSRTLELLGDVLG